MYLSSNQIESGVEKNLYRQFVLETISEMRRNRIYDEQRISRLFLATLTLWVTEVGIFLAQRHKPSAQPILCILRFLPHVGTQISIPIPSNPTPRNRGLTNSGPMHFV